MENQVTDSYLTKMPVMVIEKILSNIPDLSNVSLTCTFLYEIVCGIEKHRSVMHIRGRALASLLASRLTIDDDAVFDSIMNSSRKIQRIQLRGDCKNMLHSPLKKRQLFRMTAILKQFGANITSIEFNGFLLTVDTIVTLMQNAPKLESFTFANGTATGRMMKKRILQLSSFTSLELSNYDGHVDIAKLIPAGSLNYFRSCGAYSTETVHNILAKQRNIKHLSLDEHFDRNTICVNHLQLETLILGSYGYYSHDELVNILKYQTTLKELRIKSDGLRVSCFEWICNNLKELEVLDVFSVDLELPRLNQNIFAMLAELKKLRYFRTHGSWYFIRNGFPCDSLEKVDIVGTMPFCCDERLNSIIHSVVQSFTNLTDLEIRLADFAALSFVLSQCTTLTKLSSIIEYPSAHTFNQQHFPNIQHLTLSTNSRDAVKRNEISQSLSALAYSVPNLRSLSMPCSTPKFNVHLMKEFINGSKGLDYFSVDCFELEPDFCPDDFLEIIRRLSVQLKEFQFTFKSQGQLNSHAKEQILSNEYVDRYGVVNVKGSSRFCLHKRVRRTLSAVTKLIK